MFLLRTREEPPHVKNPTLSSSFVEPEKILLRLRTREGSTPVKDPENTFSCSDLENIFFLYLLELRTIYICPILC